MIKWLTTALLVLALALPVMADDESYPGVVEIEHVQVHPGESFPVQVWLNGNNHDLSAISLPIEFQNSQITFDSASIMGTVWQGDFDPIITTDEQAGLYRLYVVPVPVDPLPVTSFTSGLVYRLWFTASLTAQPQIVPIDTLYYDTVVAGNVEVYTRVEVADSGGNLYLPDFVPGSIEVLAPTDVDEGGDLAALPADYVLAQNYPNPFNPSTVIEFGLPSAGHVKLDVFNILGQNVATLIDGEMSAGYHSLQFDASGYPSGIYFYRLAHNEGSMTRKMILVK